LSSEFKNYETLIPRIYTFPFFIKKQDAIFHRSIIEHQLITSP